MKPITPDQLRKIWARARETGLNEEELRSIVEQVTGARSISGLSQGKAGMVIDRLKGESLEEIKARRKHHVQIRNPKVITMATTNHLHLIEKLKTKAGWDDLHILNFIRKQFKKENPRKLTYQEAGVIIKILEHEINKEAK